MCFTSRRLRLKRRLNMVCTRTANRMCLSEFTKCDHRAISQTRVSWCLSPVQIPALSDYAKNDGHGLLFFCWSCHALPNHAASSRVNVALHTVVLHSTKMALKQKRSVNFTSDERMALIELILYMDTKQSLRTKRAMPICKQAQTGGMEWCYN